MLISQTVSRTVGSKVHEVDMRMSSFNIVRFKGEIVSFINDKREVFVIEVLRRNGSATRIRGNRDFRLFDDTNSVTLVSDFTEVITLR